MSQHEIQHIATALASLQLIVQALTDKVESGLLRDGSGTGQGKRRDDAGSEAERNKSQQSCADGDDAKRSLLGEVEKGGTTNVVCDASRKELSLGQFVGVVPSTSKDASLPLLIDSSRSVSSLSFSAGASGSWADMMEDEEREKNDPIVKAGVVESSFFKEHVRTSGTKTLKQFVLDHGVSIKRSCVEDLALSRYTAGTVPVAFVNGRARLKGLALLGDKAVTLVVTDVMIAEGKSASEVQEYVSRSLSRIALSPLCVNSGLSRHIVSSSGVDLGKTAVGGEALEAVAGVVYRSGGLEAVKAFAIAMQLV